MAVHPNSLKALEENRKNTQFSGELAVEYQKRSCEKKRQKKTLAELASIFGNLKADEKTCELLKKQGVDDENLTHDMGMIYGLYASAIYFITSFIICNLPVSTNAYRFLKLGK